MQKDMFEPKILIVDDATENIDVLGEALSMYKRSVARSGEAALKLAFSSKPPDLILLDIVMPGMDGYEVIRQLKSNEQTRHIPVIFITSKNEVEDETRGLELGAVDYITKPFNIPIVKARVKTHLELKRRGDMLEHLALLDGLTGIPNRRKFGEVLEIEWRRGLRSRKPMSVILMDIDHFKNYNDNYGHSAGDDCLRKVAQALLDSCRRPGDSLCRYGGEEFVAVLPETGLNDALVIAQSIQNIIWNLKIVHGYSPVSEYLTLSIGVAAGMPRADSFPEHLVETADQALYQAKGSGRNCIKTISD